MGLLSLRDIDLSYGVLTVLKQVNFILKPGEIHALVGEHGAGKSSLARIIAGFQNPTQGIIRLNGNEFSNYSPADAKKMGVEIVSQTNHLFDQFNVASNIMISTSSPFRIYHRKKEIQAVRDYVIQNEIDLDPYRLVRSLNLSERVLVDFLKHIYTKPRILILDETLEHLSNKHLQKVIPMLRKLKVGGSAILFITHRIDDIYEIADTVSIIRDGKILITEDITMIDKINLIRLAYTQVVKEQNKKNIDFDFYQLIKYNEAILTNLPFSLLVTDTKINVRIINKAAKKFFGINDIINFETDLETFLGPENAYLFDMLKDSINGRKQNSFYNISMETKNGLSSQNVSIIPLFDGKFLIGNIITLEDMTNYEELNRQLSLSENLSSIGLLATGVAHEIANPLEIINYYIQNLRLTNPDNEKIKEIVNEIDEEIITISDIIENLLMFSENKKLEAEEVEVNYLITTIMRLLEKLSVKQGITLTFHPAPDPIHVRAARTELKQVFLNILKNSFEAIKDSGMITASTRIDDSNPEARKVLITFTDNGPGMDRQIIQNLFRPFFSSKKEPSLNMGLGLSISHGIITKYGGTMSLRNLEVSGCETLITLPTN